MYKDLTTRSQRLGWFKSSLVRKDKVNWLDAITYGVVIGVLAVIVGNLAYYFISMPWL